MPNRIGEPFEIDLYISDFQCERTTTERAHLFCFVCAKTETRKGLRTKPKWPIYQ